MLQLDVEGEMRKLRLELKQTLDLYNSACKEAISAKQKVLHCYEWDTLRFVVIIFPGIQVHFVGPSNIKDPPKKMDYD